MPTLQLPKLGNLAELNETASRQALVSYIYRLTEQLQTTLNNLDEDNFNSAYNTTLSGLIASHERATELAALYDQGSIAGTESVRQAYQTLRDSIAFSADEVTAAYQVLVEQTNMNIRSYVEANFYAADPSMTLDEKISSMILQTADAIRLEFNTSAEIMGDAIDAIAVDFNTYFKFDINGLEIGRIGESLIVTRISNSRMEFAIAGTTTVLAYIDNTKLHIDNAEVDRLSIGNTNDGWLDIDMTATGIYFKWRD